MTLTKWYSSRLLLACLPQHGHENWCQDCGWQFAGRR